MLKSGYFGHLAKIKCKPREAPAKKSRCNSAGVFMSKNKRLCGVRVANSRLAVGKWCKFAAALRPQGNGYDTAFWMNARITIGWFVYASCALRNSLIAPSGMTMKLSALKNCFRESCCVYTRGVRIYRKVKTWCLLFSPNLQFVWKSLIKVTYQLNSIRHN